MTIEERRRSQLFERWTATWSKEDAEAMLELFPPPGRAVATSDDIAALDAKIDALDTKVDTLRGELGRQDDTLRGELARQGDTFHGVLHNEIGTLRTEFDLKIEAATAQLTAVFRTEIQRAIVTQTRITIFSMVTAFAAVSALALGLD